MLLTSVNELVPCVDSQTCTNYSKELSGMKLLYADMTEEEQEQNKVYMLCSDIIRSYAFQRATDLKELHPVSHGRDALPYANVKN